MYPSIVERCRIRELASIEDIVRVDGESEESGTFPLELCSLPSYLHLDVEVAYVGEGDIGAPPVVVVIEVVFLVGCLLEQAAWCEREGESETLVGT